MPSLFLAESENAVDAVTADLTVVSRARAVMQQMLLRCIQDPLDTDALQAAYDAQQMLREDLAAANSRLRGALSCV